MESNRGAPPPDAGRPYGGPERRDPERTDRRRAWRGGRRATDAIARLAGFVYKLLTEPPR